MRSYYQTSQRQRSRERVSVDRSSYQRDVSPDVYRPYEVQKKRVKFNDQQDIKVFKKQDQPIAKPLNDDEILQVKKRIENQISKLYDFNWDQKKHFDALSEQNSMKEQKQKQKELYDKLISMKEQIQFYSPFFLFSTQLSQQMALGSGSEQRQAHSQRTKDILGCYYTHVNQIPNQPLFQINSSTNKIQPKIIKFNPGGVNQSEQFSNSKNKSQQLKGILKMSGQNNKKSESRQQSVRQITPRLLWLLKDMQVNKSRYNKQMTQMLLKPYKQSRQLGYWLQNQNLLTQLLKNYPSGTPAPPLAPPPVTLQPTIPPQLGPNPNIGYNPMNRISPSPGTQLRTQYPQQQQPYDPMMKTQKYKTVHCKFFLGPQGCVKTQNCTFIHDERMRAQQQLSFPANRSQFNQTQQMQGGYIQQDHMQQQRQGFQQHRPGNIHQVYPNIGYVQQPHQHPQEPANFQQLGMYPQNPQIGSYNMMQSQIPYNPQQQQNRYQNYPPRQQYPDQQQQMQGYYQKDAKGGQNQR